MISLFSLFSFDGLGKKQYGQSPEKPKKVKDECKIILLEREIALMKNHFQHNPECEKISGYYAFMECNCGFEDKKNQIERMKR